MSFEILTKIPHRQNCFMKYKPYDTQKGCFLLHRKCSIIIKQFTLPELTALTVARLSSHPSKAHEACRICRHVWSTSLYQFYYQFKEVVVYAHSGRWHYLVIYGRIVLSFLFDLFFIDYFALLFWCVFLRGLNGFDCTLL